MEDTGKRREGGRREVKVFLPGSFVTATSHLDINSTDQNGEDGNTPGKSTWSITNPEASEMRISAPSIVMGQHWDRRPRGRARWDSPDFYVAYIQPHCCQCVKV
jgi:hypothetical protein